MKYWNVFSSLELLFTVLQLSQIWLKRQWSVEIGAFTPSNIFPKTILKTLHQCATVEQSTQIDCVGEMFHVRELYVLKVTETNWKMRGDFKLETWRVELLVWTLCDFGRHLYVWKVINWGWKCGNRKNFINGFLSKMLDMWAGSWKLNNVFKVKTG